MFSMNKNLMKIRKVYKIIMEIVEKEKGMRKRN